MRAHRAEGLGGVMEENRAQLAERGEKLRGLQDKTDRMQVWPFCLQQPVAALPNSLLRKSYAACSL